MSPKNILSILTTSLLGATAIAEIPEGIYIQSLQANGSGCPAGSFAANVSPDGQTFTILLDNYLAAINMQSPMDRKTCQFSVNFKVPNGWTFAITTADYRGFAYAELGTQVAHQALYSFQGSKPLGHRWEHEVKEHHSFRPFEIRGPYKDNYTIHQELDNRTAPWSPCNSEESQTLTITTTLMARSLRGNANLQAQITLDSIDGSLQSQRYQLAWKRCGAVKPDRPAGRDEHHRNEPGDGRQQPPRPPEGPGRPQRPNRFR